MGLVRRCNTAWGASIVVSVTHGLVDNGSEGDDAVVV